MTRKHLKGDADNKMQAPAEGVPAKLLTEVANLHGRLAKIRAKTTVCDEERDNERRRK